MNIRLASVAALTACVLCACVETTPRYDKNFGTSVRALTAQQIANPTASPAAAAPPLDARAARSALDNYRAGYRNPTPDSGSPVSVQNGGH